MPFKYRKRDDVRGETLELRLDQLGYVPREHSLSVVIISDRQNRYSKGRTYTLTLEENER